MTLEQALVQLSITAPTASASRLAALGQEAVGAAAMVVVIIVVGRALRLTPSEQPLVLMPIGAPGTNAAGDPAEAAGVVIPEPPAVDRNLDRGRPHAADAA